MPHVVLEYSKNIPKPVDVSRLFPFIHEKLVAIVGVDLNNIQSRSYEAEHYWIADGDPKHIFVALTVHFYFEHREATVPILGDALLRLLQETFHHAAPSATLHISVNIDRLHRGQYFKWVGTQP